MRTRITVVASIVTLMTLTPAVGASAHVHGITPLLTLASPDGCGVTSPANTGANRAPSAVIEGLIPRDVGRAPLGFGDGGFAAPVGCAD